MPPRKKPNSSSSSSASSIKKSSHNSNQPQPPSKFGIQHFFDRHTQTQNASQNPKPPLTSKAAAAVVSAPVSTDRSNENGPASKKPDRNESVSQNTPEENVVLVGVKAADENLSEVSPEVSKSVSLKRFKFSILFRERPKREWKDLQPYIRDLSVPGLSSEGLLLKYTRRTQPTQEYKSE